MKGFANLKVFKRNSGYVIREDTFLGETVAIVDNANLTDEKCKEIAGKIAAALNDDISDCCPGAPSEDGR